MVACGLLSSRELLRDSTCFWLHTRTCTEPHISEHSLRIAARLGSGAWCSHSHIKVWAKSYEKSMSWASTSPKLHFALLAKYSSTFPSRLYVLSSTSITSPPFAYIFLLQLLFKNFLCPEREEVRQWTGGHHCLLCLGLSALFLFPSQPMTIQQNFLHQKDH